MNREDYVTHLILAAAFLGALSPFLVEEGMTLGSGLYYAGTATQITIASIGRLFLKE